MPGREPPPRQLALPGTEAAGALPPPRPANAEAAGGALSDDELAHWVAFTRVRGIGPARFQQLLTFFGDAATAWRAGRADLEVAGLDTRTTESLLAHRTAHPDPARELEALAKHQITALPLVDPTYPELLREVYLPPAILYVRGTLTPADGWSVAVVGTRRCTSYGTQVTEMITDGLARQQITIISGLALGIDTVAHKTALKAGGRTIAVLGSGLNRLYPSENAKLAATIAEHGALVSEFPLDTQPEASNFPARNRVVSGLARGVLVTEAPLRPKPSGALITARFALEQNREVFAVPGPIPGSILRAHSEGTNKLIQDGAKLVMQAADILEALQMQAVPQQQEMREQLPASETEATILTLLAAASEPQHIDELCRASGLPTAEVTSTLLMMRLKGMILEVGAATYARPR